MKRKPRIYYSDGQRALMWERWRQGNSLQKIAQLFDRNHSSVERILAETGGLSSPTMSFSIVANAGRARRDMWDWGKELADHKRFTLDTHIQVFFCDPHQPWQRGSNENTNGLLRQYFPKGLDLCTYSQENLDEVARRLNERPRKTLNY